MKAVALVLTACVADRAPLDVPVRFAAGEPTWTVDGVDVRLTRAEATLADLWLEGPADARAAWRLPSLVPSAWAHPGHDFAGDLTGELVGTWSLDLLAGDAELGVARCYEGPTATARLQLVGTPPTRLSGVAVVDGTERPFDFVVPAASAIAGIPFTITLDAEAPPAGLRVGVDLAHALSFVDWRTPDADADGVLTVADGVLDRTVTFGVVSTPTWNLTRED